MVEGLPVLYCKECGHELEPYLWSEGYEGRMQYDKETGVPFKEYPVYYRCPKRSTFFNLHEPVCHTFRKEASSNYYLPESIKEYRRTNPVMI